MRFSARKWFGLVASCALLAGCGEQPVVGPAPGKFDSALAGPNRRFKGKEDQYKQALGKDGRLMYKPGMKNPLPPAQPKS